MRRFLRRRLVRTRSFPDPAVQEDYGLSSTPAGWVDTWPSGHRLGPWSDEELKILEELDARD